MNKDPRPRGTVPEITLLGAVTRKALEDYFGPLGRDACEVDTDVVIPSWKVRKRYQHAGAHQARVCARQFLRDVHPELFFRCRKAARNGFSWRAGLDRDLDEKIKAKTGGQN